MLALTLAIPVPPSINHAFVNVPRRGRVKSKAYRDWRTQAGWALQSQPHAKVPGRVVVDIAVRRPSPNADVDNRIKPVLDLLVLHHVIDDDKNVARVSARWADVDACVVTVRPAEAA